MTPLWLTLLACRDTPATSQPGSDTAAPTSVCGEGEVADDAFGCVPQACGIGRWGNLEPADLYVDGTAESGSGTLEAPLATVAEALELAKDQPGTRIAIAAGTYLENLEISNRHEDLELAGRCAALVTLDGSTGEQQATLLASSRFASHLGLRDLTIVGGTGGVVICSGDATLERLDIADNGWRGLSLAPVECTGLLAEATAVTLSDSMVRSTFYDRAMGDSPVCGIAQEGATTLSLIGSVVSDNEGTGVAVAYDGALADISDTVIEGTVPSGSHDNGGGLSVASGGHATVADCLIRANLHGGVWAGGASAELERVQVLDNQYVGVSSYRNDSHIDLRECTIEGTTAAEDGEGGWGLMVQDCASADLEDVQLRSNTIANLATVFSDEDYLCEEGNRVVGLDIVLSGADYAEDRGQGALGAKLGYGSDADLSSVTVEDNASGGIQVGISVAHEGDLQTRAALSDLVVEGNNGPGILTAGQDVWVTLERAQLSGNGIPGATTAGLGAMDGSTLEAAEVTVAGHTGYGLFVGGEGSLLSFAEGTVSGSRSHDNDDGGYAALAMDRGVLELQASQLVDSSNLGLLVGAGGVAELGSVRIEGVRRTAAAAVATGVVVQEASSLVATDLAISGVDGPGLSSVSESRVVAEQVDLRDVAFAGILLNGGALALQDVIIEGVAADPNLGGGVGVFARPKDDVVSTLDLTRATIRSTVLAGAYFNGNGSFRMEDTTIEGAARSVLANGLAVHGDGIVAVHGVTGSQDGIGLTLSGVTLQGAAGSGVFLDESWLDVADTVFADNATDLWQQGCDAVEVQVVEDCPTYDSLFIDLDFDLRYDDIDLE